MLQQECDGVPDSASDSKESPAPSATSPEPVSSQSRKRLFRFMDNAPRKKPKISEVDDFLEFCQNCKESNPLAFWKAHQHQFPKLAKLARKYLAVPASTGSVERLLSVAGALARARRANLTPATLKALIMYRDFKKYY